MTHAWHIDEAQYRRHEERRGRRFAYEALAAERTALVVVDMVPFFVDQLGSASAIVANVNRLAAVVRGSGGTVAWVTPAPDHLPVRDEFYGPAIAARYADSGGAVATSLETAVDDLFVQKTAASAFFPGRCELHERLAERGIDTVIVVGAVANVCCESTVRDAWTLGYRVIMVADANAAVTDADLNATLHTVYRSFGDVRPTEQVVQLIEQGSP